MNFDLICTKNIFLVGNKSWRRVRELSSFSFPSPSYNYNSGPNNSVAEIIVIFGIKILKLNSSGFQIVGFFRE